MSLLPPFPVGALHDAPACLSVDVDLAGGRLRVAGRLDRTTARVLHVAMRSVALTDRTEWTVDITDLTVADHAGLRVIGAVYRRFLRHDRRLTLAGASPGLQRALTRLRLGQHVLDDAPRVSVPA